VALEGRTIFIFRASSSGLEAAGAALPGPGARVMVAAAAGRGAASRGAASRPLKVLVETNGVPSCVVTAAGGGADFSDSGAGGRINRRSD